ncbi:MAG TPA: class I SAM-dependent methyltransferase [Acidimicrobiales bacterium]|nr:class I SAM-dependent methyltransferase [Acidimicrobiales bacterium]
MWAIISDRDKKHARWDLHEFLESGRTEVARALETIRATGLSLGTGSALDFGCGLGRLTAALGQHFDHVMGLDVSPAMVLSAQRIHHGVSGLEFTANLRADLNMLASESFDFVFTSRVLQHLPDPEMAKAYISEFVRVLKPGGIAQFQIPVRTGFRMFANRRTPYVVLRRLGLSPAFLYGRLGLHPMHLISVPFDEVRATIVDAGSRIVTTEPDGHWSLLENSGFVFTVLKPT